MAVIDQIRSGTGVDQIDPDVYLGYLLWYSFSEKVRIPYEEGLQLLAKHGLGADQPRKPLASDVFRRCASAAKREKIPVAGQDGVFRNYLLRNIASKDPKKTVRRIVRETVDQKGQRLDYTQLRDIIFDRTAETVTSEPVTWALDPVGEELAEQVARDFEFWKGCLYSGTIRELVRRTLVQNGAISVRPTGGIYFIQSSHGELIRSIEAFLDEVPGDCGLHSLPLIDDRKQRLMLKRAFEDETTNEIDRMLAEMTDIRTTGELTEERYVALMAQGSELVQKTHSYEQLLSQVMSETQTRLRLYQSQVLDLRHLVKREG